MEDVAMKGWMRPHELGRQRDRDRFDPIAEGYRYGLSREVSLEIWDRACAEAIDRSGERDPEQAQRRFHEIAARIAARGKRVGKSTRVDSEQGRHSFDVSDVEGTARRTNRVPGKQTLVDAEERRWARLTKLPAPAHDTDVPKASEGDGHADERSSTHANEHAIHRRENDERRLPVATLDRMERAFGQRFDDVQIDVNSAEVPDGVEAFTRGRHIFFGHGAFDPDSKHGEHVIAHELAHVAQQSRPMSGGRPTRAALEADAHQAATDAVAGRTASVSLFAPAAAALAFSHGEAGPPASARSTPASSPGARGGAPAAGSPARASASAGPAIPRAKPGSTATARPVGVAALTGPASAAPRRGATGDGLRIPEAPSALTPAAAGRLRTAQAGNQGNAVATTTLPSGQQQTDVGRAAVEEPQAEQDARAQHGVVSHVDDRPPPSPEIEAACARIRQVIRDKRPPDEDRLVEAKPREMAQEAGNQMSAGVEQRAGTVRQGYADMQQPPAGSPSSAPVPPTLPPQHAQTQPVDASAGAPDPLKSDDVSLDADAADQKQQIENAGMNTEPGKLVQDGPIGDARDGADELSELAKTDPEKVIADQAKAITKAKDDMRALQQAADKALADARAGAVDQMGTHTTGVKGSEEQQRAQAGEKMKGIFDRTQKTVDTLLQPLAGNAVTRWDTGVAQLSTDFEASLAGVKRRIDERHSGFGGGLVKAWDKLTHLPDWAVEGYDRAEAKFADGATSLIRDISRDVNDVINNCKALIKQARKDIDTVVKSLPASLQAWAQGEAAKLGQQLDALDKRVDQTQKGINQDLINRANSAVQEVRERVHDLREKAKGMLAKIAAALAEFAKNPAKAIVNGLLRMLGISPDSFWSMVDRLGDVVGAIAKDPVKFGKTLISGAAQGFTQFFENFPQHLREILMSWLFGTVATAGVPMPTDFSGPGIMATVLGVVGIDSGLVTSMLGADLSDPAEMAEAQQELAGVLSGDSQALVNLLREHFDPASLMPMIKEAVMSFLIQALIVRVAARIAAMLVPGGAILQAVEAIFRVLVWVVTNAARIFTLIESLVATAGQAVAGNVAGVAAGVESALVQIIVLVIDFLAGYLGLGGLPGKLKGVIMKLSGKLKAALKKVVDAVKKRAKARAKAKRDQTKPNADTKPATDASATTQPPRQDPQNRKTDDDDKDPRNRKPDDAKDPQNRKPDADDKDPRNRKPDADDKDPRNRKPDSDGKDPRNRKPDVDDKDPRNRKPDDDRDPKKPRDDDDRKKKHENDLAEARRAARAAANRGWTAARHASEREVLSKAELKRVLSRAEHSTPQVRISLEIQDKGTSWGVEAEAKVGSARASDTEGNGWIARGDGNQPWYAARDLRAFNRKLIDDGFRQLEKDRSDDNPDERPDGRAQYDHKVRQGEQVVENMQQRLDREIRGLKADIDMEPWSSVAEDRLIRTELRVKPNTTTQIDDVPLGSVGQDEDIETPRALVEKQNAMLKKPKSELSNEAGQTPSGTVLYRSSVTDPKVVTKRLLSKHPSAKLDKKSGVLSLPPLPTAAVAGATDLESLAKTVADITGVSKVTFTKHQEGWALDGSINPTAVGLVTADEVPAGLEEIYEFCLAELKRVRPDVQTMIAICHDAGRKFDVVVEDRFDPDAQVSYVTFQTTCAHREQLEAAISAIDRQQCPACGFRYSQIRNSDAWSSPHNLVPRQMWERVIRETLRAFDVPNTRADGDQFVGALIGIVASGGPATSEDRQCRDCEQAQDQGRELEGLGGVVGRRREPQSAPQRRAAARMWRATSVRHPRLYPENTPREPWHTPPEVIYEGQQFAGLTDSQLLMRIQLMVGRVIEEMRRLLTMRPTSTQRPANHPIYTEIVQTRLEDFLLRIHVEIVEAAYQKRPARASPP